MIGTKKPAQMMKELRKALRKNDQDLKAWLDERLATLRSESSRDSKVQEDLLWVRKVLSEAVAAKKPRGKKSAKPRVKKTPAA